MFVKSTCLSCLASQSLGIWRSLTDCQLARVITSLIFSFQPLFPPSRNSVIDSVHKLVFSERCQSPGCPQRLLIRGGNGIRCLVVESILKGLYSTFIDVLTLTNKLVAFCRHCMIGHCRSFLRFDAKNDYFPN